MPEHFYDPHATLQPAPDPVNESPPPFLNPADVDRLHDIRQSSTWGILAAGMAELRESLLNSHPKDDAALNQTWGRIMQLSDLLQGGPLLIMNASKMAEQRRAGTHSDAADVAVHTYKGE
jgi:hypothetical protein